MGAAFDVMTAENFHAALKSATDSKHRALEQLSISRNLADGSITLDDYLSYLRAMHDFVGSVERWALPVVADLLPDAPRRIKAGWLASDLGRGPDGFTDLFPNAEWSQGFALGVFYVLEGSTLGGRYILSRLSQTGMIPKEKTRFFEGYGNASGAMWKQFLNVLSAYATNQQIHEEIIRGANFAFDTIKKHLAKVHENQGHR